MSEVTSQSNIATLPTTSVTDRYIEAARKDAENLHRTRTRIEEEVATLVERSNALHRELRETIELQNIALGRITQLEKAKING